MPPTPICVTTKKPDMRRAWWRVGTLLLNAARALMTPMRGVMVSMGYQKCIEADSTRTEKEDYVFHDQE